ncbi:hypothetical protein Acr_04g0006440 [Actinidia rufa]|uniref:Uncharacterized protein n=1 Tax=Actinidia rufa TaxID=165716 RepID=A0A7J0EI85_9ERIC|nr:hypothetical protein Acr_04g0006440 [Actinidia rufa]
MNIVKGVADLIRRTSSGQSTESGSGSQLERLSPPTPRICFSDVGDEAILSTLWGRYENAFNKAEKRKLFYIFLKQFLIIYKSWEPIQPGQFAEVALSAAAAADHIHVNDIVVGCSTGHPAEIILTLIEEITHITALVTELGHGWEANRVVLGKVGGVGALVNEMEFIQVQFHKAESDKIIGSDNPYPIDPNFQLLTELVHVNTSMVHSTTDQVGTSTSLTITSEGLPVLDALTIVTRSMHNCRVFGYYGGIQKLTALMKATQA